MSNKQILGKLKAKRRKARLGKSKEQRQELNARKQFVRENKGSFGTGRQQRKYTEFDRETGRAYGFLIPSARRKLDINEFAKAFIKSNKTKLYKTELAEKARLMNISLETLLKRELQVAKIKYGTTSLNEALKLIIDKTYLIRSASQQGVLNFLEGLQGMPAVDYNDNDVGEMDAYQYVCYLIDKTTLEADKVEGGNDRVFFYIDGSTTIQITLLSGRGKSYYAKIERI